MINDLNKVQLFIKCDLTNERITRFYIQIDIMDMWFKMNGPAIISCDGSKQWWGNDKFHNENKLIVVYTNGCVEAIENERYMKNLLMPLLS